MFTSRKVQLDTGRAPAVQTGEVLFGSSFDLAAEESPLSRQSVAVDGLLLLLHRRSRGWQRHGGSWFPCWAVSLLLVVVGMV